MEKKKKALQTSEKNGTTRTCKEDEAGGVTANHFF
jgi:hypothetical protein